MKKLLVFACLSLLLLVNVTVSAADFWPAHCIKPILIGQTINGTLSTSSGCYNLQLGSDRWYDDVYTFTGTAGQKVAITMNGVGNFDPYLYLYLGNTGNWDNWIAEGDDGGGGVNARIPANTGYITLPSTGTYFIWASTYDANTGGSYALTLSSDSSTPTAEVTEFYHSGLDHYFMTADPNEAAGLDANPALGWLRTGNSFKSGGSTPVCRFYGSMSPGPNSHFYTLAGDECDSLKQLQASTPATEKRWNFESLDFSSTPASDGTCESGTIPVYRAYNSGYAKGVDSNHRMVRKVSAIQEVVNRGWVSEGVVMCAPASSSQGITGGNFVDPSGLASVNVTTGTLPSYVNASGPTLKAVTQLNTGVVFDPAGGEVNVTRGGLGYEFDLTGDSGFVTTVAGAIKISLPINTANIPVADLASPIKVFMRIFNLDTGSNADVTGEIATTGGVTRLTVETRGLPNRFVALVVYNPNMDATLVDDSTPSSSQAIPDAHERAATTWPAKAWCVIYNASNATLIAQIKAIRGTSAAPTREEIKNTISYKQGARKAQVVYERDGFLAPNLYIGKPCGGNTPHYVIHMSEKLDSAYWTGTPDIREEVGTDEAPYGRIYIQYGHTSIMGHVVAHEMHHAIQSSYELHGDTVGGYKEGTATIYGNTIYNKGTISNREEIQRLDVMLMTPDLQRADPPPGSFMVGDNGYANQDFFAYVGKQYNNGSLAYISGLYTRMHNDIGAGVSNAPLSLLNGSLDAYLKSAFSLGLKDIYLDYVKQRALAHNTASQFGRTAEITQGFADNLFKGTLMFNRFPVPVCNDVEAQASISNAPLSSNSLRIKPIQTSGTFAGDGPTIVIKVTPSFGTLGGAWSGFSYRDNVIDTIKTSNAYKSFGKKAGDEIVIVLSNLDFAQTGRVTIDLSCTTLQISALAPAKGPVDTTVTISGTGFGTGTETLAVYFNGIKAPSVTWVSDTQISAKVPQNATTGDVVVEVNGVRSNGLVFTVDAAITVSVSPTTASISTGASQAFTATVSGSTNKGVTWSASGGSISSAGLYTAPAVAGTYYVTATSQADTSKKAVATITVTATQGQVVSGHVEWWTGSGSSIEDWLGIKYSISGGGGLIRSPAESVKTESATYSGKLSGTALTLAGSGFSSPGWIATNPTNFPMWLEVSVDVDGDTKSYKYSTPAGQSMSATFSVSVPIPANAAHGSFSARACRTSSYRDQCAGVSGSLSR